MDLTSIVICLGILAYGGIAYARREYEHRKMLEILKKGEDLPKPARTVSPWELVTTGCMGILLLAASGAILWLGMRGSAKYALPYVVMAIAALPPALLLGMIWWRDYRLLKKPDAQRKEASQ